MSNVSQLQTEIERKERRRLHLREVTADGAIEVDGVDKPEQSEEPLEAKEPFGAVLRAARVARGEDTATAAAKLKIRREQLEAIENGEYEKLPGRTYVVGFVRSYARYLELDADAIVQRFKDESAGEQIAKPVDLTFPEAPEEHRVLPNPSLLVWAMLIAMVIYGISYLTMPGRKGPTTAKADPNAIIIEDPKTAKPVEQASVSDTWSAPQPKPTEQAEQQNDPTTFVSGAQVLAESETSEPAPLWTGDPVHAADMKSALTQLTDLASVAVALPASTADSRITFKAVEETYLKIRDPKQSGAEAVLIERVLQPGESYQVPARTGLTMKTGNAGGLQVEVDGRAMGPLGKRGEVITRIPVDPSYFLDRLAVSQ